MLRVLTILVFSTLLNAQFVGLEISGGQIEGRVVDRSLGPLGAEVKVIEPETGNVLAQTVTTSDGRFRTEFLPQGRYNVAAWSQGFTRTLVRDVEVPKDRSVKLNDITLEVASRDPAVACSLAPTQAATPENGTAKAGRFRLKVNCGIDIDQRKVVCSHHGLDKTDVRFVSDQTSMHLVTANGAGLSIPKCAEMGCDGSPPQIERLRLQGLGPGVDLCVRSKDGAIALLFFMSDVDSDTKEIAFSYVTRTK